MPKFDKLSISEGASGRAEPDRPLSRKQREIREREGRILDVARDLIAAEGYGGLSMDRIAEAIAYSKGTVYQHFASKEDVMLELSLRAIAAWSRHYDLALQFRGSSRERLLAIHLGHDLAAHLHPVEYECIYAVRAAGIREKVPPERRAEQAAALERLFERSASVVAEGVRDGDLVLGAGATPQSLIYGFWSLHYGEITLETYDIQYRRMGVRDQRRTLRRTLQAIMDGLGWRPLSSEHDYVAVEKRILREVFRAEQARLRRKR